jgi:hypothetical protein
MHTSILDKINNKKWFQKYVISSEGELKYNFFYRTFGQVNYECLPDRIIFYQTEKRIFFIQI